MKKSLLAIACAALVGAGVVYAATPTDIKYASKGSAMLGGDYLKYTVVCSDGKKREITAWDNRKKWCVGTSKSGDCSNDQLKTAKQACK